MDEMVLETQKWVNKTYGAVAGFDRAPENGRTGWATIYSLREGLQHEVGIGSVAAGFGPATEAGVSGVLGKLTKGYKGNLVKLIEGAFWCKGINPGDFTGEFTSHTQEAIATLQKNAGMPSNGVMTTELMKALFDMSAFTLVAGGSSSIRSMQQYLNGHYHDYFGILPCDGVYQRDTNTALIYGLQAVEGMGVGLANGYYGPGTVSRTPTLSSGSTGAAVKILQYGLMVNGVYDGPFDGSFSSSVASAVVAFRKFMNLPPFTSTADLTVIKGLLTSNGNTNRAAKAFDASTPLTSTTASALKAKGFEIVGRYLTGSVGVGAARQDKNLTTSEISAITGAGLSIFPIYQDGGWDESYFSASQGSSDAATATKTAKKLGFPAGATIYFAVDVDIEEGNIAGTVMPYIQAVHSNMSYYKVGIYGTRNVCAHALNAGYTSKCFVSNMSTGYSGNLGFKMPKAWAFDQFFEKTDVIPIDKDAVSGLDKGTNKFNKSDSVDSKYVAKNLLDIFGIGSLDFGVKHTLWSAGPITVSVKADQSISHPNGSHIFKISNGKPAIDISNLLTDSFHFPKTAADFVASKAKGLNLSSKIDDGDLTLKVSVGTDMKYAVDLIWNVTKFGNEELTDAISVTLEAELDLHGFGDAINTVLSSISENSEKLEGIAAVLALVIIIPAALAAGSAGAAGVGVAGVPAAAAALIFSLLGYLGLSS